MAETDADRLCRAADGMRPEATHSIAGTRTSALFHIAFAGLEIARGIYQLVEQGKPEEPEQQN